MKPLRLGCLFACLLGLIALQHRAALPVRAADPDGWKAGVARAKITPDEPMWMAGYGSRDRVAEGTLQDLWAKALVLEDAAGNRVVVVSTDLLGLPRSISENVCDRLREKLDLQRDAIMLNSSHTHCGPVLRDALYDVYPLDDDLRTRIEAYSERLERQLVALVVEATEKLAPASVATGSGTAGFAVNRRNNREADVPALRERNELKGPVDHAVPVLRVDRADGSPLAVVFGYACHNTTLSFYQWCGDYAGYAQANIEAQHPGTTALFFSGCGADSNPLPRRSVSLCEQYGRELADAVEHVLARRMEPLSPSVRSAFSVIDLPLDELPTRDELSAKAETGSVYERRWATRLLAKLDRGEPLTQEYPYPVQAWRLGGRQTWIALGGEVVVDYSLRLKAELGESIWVTGYANDVMAYIPSLRVLEEGGYEGATSMVVYGLPTTWAPEVEELVVAEVHRLVEAVTERRSDARVPRERKGVTARRPTAAQLWAGLSTRLWAGLPTRPPSRRSGDLRSDLWDGPETAPQLAVRHKLCAGLPVSCARVSR